MPKKSQLEKEDTVDIDEPETLPVKVKKPRTPAQIEATRKLVERNKAKREEAKANKAKVEALEKIEKGEVKEDLEAKKEDPPVKVYKKPRAKKAPKPKPKPPTPQTSLLMRSKDLPPPSDDESSVSSEDSYIAPAKPHKNPQQVYDNYNSGVEQGLENPLSKPRSNVKARAPPKPVNLTPQYRMPMKYRFRN